MKMKCLRLLGCSLGFVLSPLLAGAQPYGGPGIPGVTRRVPMQPRPPAFGANAPSVIGQQPPQNPNPQPPPAPAAAPVLRPAPVYLARPADPEKDRAAREQAAQKAVEFERKRAEEDFGWAQYALGVRYLTGDRVEMNLEQARKWLEKAAKNGERQAVKKLAELDQPGSAARPHLDAPKEERKTESDLEK